MKKKFIFFINRKKFNSYIPIVCTSTLDSPHYYNLVELYKENLILKKDIENIINLLYKNCDDLEGTEEEFDSLERWEKC